MKLFLYRLLTFVLMIPIGWLLLFGLAMASPAIESRFIAAERNWGFVNAKTAEWADLRDKNQLDVALFGSSTCYSGIDPDAFTEFDLQAFNFCSSAQSIPHSFPLVEALLEDQVPNVIALDVYPRIWGKTTISSEPVRDWIVNGNLWDWHWAKAYAQLTSVSRSPFAWMTMLYYPIRRHIAPAGLRAGQDPNGIYSGRGFVYRTFPPLLEMPHDERFKVDLSNVEIDALNRLSKLCEEREIELILINPPQLIEESFTRSDCMQGITWIEGNDWPGAKIPSNYYDDHHLVGEGAQQYSHWLAEQISQQAKSLR